MPLLLFLFLSVLPLLAHAQAPPPLAWSMIASTCVPDDTAGPLLRVNAHYVTVRPGLLTPRVNGIEQPIRLRCPVTPGASAGFQGQWRWHSLEMVVLDPDGPGRGSRVSLALFTFDPAISTTLPLQVAFLDTGGAVGGRWPEVLARPIAPAIADFSQATYWLEISLWRTLPLVLPPRVYTVRLHAVPDFVPPGSP